MSQRPAVLTEEIEELRKKVALLGKRPEYIEYCRRTLRK
jgi:hypothetical protein